MVLSTLLLLILAVDGLFAVDSDPVANDLNKSGGGGAVHARRLRADRQAGTVIPTSLKTSEGSDADSKPSLRDLPGSDDVDSYVNDNFPDNDLLLYAVYDYDDGANDKYVHVIDPRSLAASPVLDASEALMRKINETAT